MAKISEEAQSWLNYFIANPQVRISYTSLMALKVPRRRAMAVIKELENAKKVIRTRSLGHGTRIVISPTEVTNEVTAPVTWIPPYSHSASKAIVPIAIQLEMTNIVNKFFDEVKEGEKDMGYEFFEDKAAAREKALERALSDLDNKFNARWREEQKALSSKERAEAAAARKAVQLEAARTRFIDRNKSPENWTVRDFVYAFSAELSNLWDIPPADIVRSRFQQAMSAFRQKHSTNGAIEKELMTLFFSTIQSDKYTDGNHVWKAFLYKAPDLLQTARERVITPEQIETAIIDDTARAERKLALFDEDDDV